MYATYRTVDFCKGCGKPLYDGIITTETVDDWLTAFSAREMTCDNCHAKAVVARESLQVILLP
jgi:hypothetical protein